jgi:Mn-dependent DtxR family transcriptional regulator
VQILEYMKRLPQATAPMLASELGMTAPTVTSALNHMGERGVIGNEWKKRDRGYVYRQCLAIGGR